MATTKKRRNRSNKGKNLYAKRKYHETVEELIRKARDNDEHIRRQQKKRAR